MYSEEQVNTGILLNALYGKYSKGINSYSIHNEWWAIADIHLLYTFEKANLLTIDDKKIAFTEIGVEIITALFDSKVPVPIGEVMKQVYINAEKVLDAFLLKAK